MSETASVMLTKEEAHKNPIDRTKLISLEQFAKTFDKSDWVTGGRGHAQEKPCELNDVVIDPAVGIRMQGNNPGYEYRAVVSVLKGEILIEALPDRIRIFQQDLDRDPEAFLLQFHLARRSAYAPWLAEQIAPIEAERLAQAERREAQVQEFIEQEKRTAMLTREESWRRPIDTSRLVSIERFAELYAAAEWVDGDCDAARGHKVADAFVDAVIDPRAGIRLVREDEHGRRRAQVLSLLDHEVEVEALPERIRIFKKCGPNWWPEFHLARRDVHTPWLAERCALYEAEMEIAKANYQAQEEVRAEKRRLDEARWDALLAGVRDAAIGRKLVGIQGVSDEVTLTFDDGFVMKIVPFNYDYDTAPCLSVNDIELAWPDTSESDD